MADPRDLIRELARLDDLLASCMRCGMCQAVCPVYGQTGHEAHVARGKIALLDGLAHKLIADPEGVRERLDNCLLCGACAAACPSGVRTMDIFLAARSILTSYLGLSPVKKLIFRGLLEHPRLFELAAGLGARLQGLVTRPADENLGTSCSRLLEPVLGPRHFPRLARRSLLDQTGPLDEPAGASGLRVAFFPGCMVDKVYPRVGLAALEILRHYGVGVYMPKNQACCGIPALSSGDLNSFHIILAKNLELFFEAGYDYLVTPCATCTSVLRKTWPSQSGALSADTCEKINALAAKTLDMGAFLVDVLNATPEPATPESDATPLTWHDPCHLKKSLGVAAQPRALLRANPAHVFVEMDDADSCCGCGGSYTLAHPDLSSAIGQRKRDAILRSGARTLATGCPACMMQIADMLSRHGDAVTVRHVLEIHAETLSRRPSANLPSKGESTNNAIRSAS